jgi:alpha-L-fucosidase
MKINLSLTHLLFAFLLTTLAFTGRSQSIVLAKPSADQLAFQNMEMGVFIHFSIDTYADRGSISGSTPASAFNPTQLNAEQWVLAAKAMGAKYVVLTARHEQGFCLWPTKTTDYSIKSSPYKNGHGDIVKEFVTACRKYGLKVGLYTPPWIDSHWESIHNGFKGGETANIDKLNDPATYKLALKKEKEQIKELMTNYGPLVFIWDDHFGRSDVLDSIPLGGKFRDFYKAVTSYAHSLQPHCLLLGRDVEHVGNENGHASYPLWNALNTIDGTVYTVSKTYRWEHANTGDPFGKLYRPQISCTTNAFSTGGWMWNGPREPQPLERRMKAYYETVGRGSSVIINLTPDRSGLIPGDLVAAARETGDEIKRRFGHPIASSTSKAPVQTINFVGPKTFNHIITMEDLHNGQKISKYVIEAKINGHWIPVVTGETIGHKRIDQFPEITATALRFKVTGVVSRPAVMRYVGIFNVSGI